MLRWLLQASASLAAKIALGSTATFLAGYGAIIFASWDYLKGAPWPLFALLGLGGLSILTLIVITVSAWLRSAAIPEFQPRYLAWYKLPFRRVSWDFANFLGAVGNAGCPVLIYSFQARLRVNWADAMPKNAYIQSRNTAERIPITIDPASANHLNSNVAVGSLSRIPRGRWFRVSAIFSEGAAAEDGLTKEQLLARFDGFSLIFEYENGSSGRDFTRNEIIIAIDTFWGHFCLPAEPYLALRPY